VHSFLPFVTVYIYIYTINTCVKDTYLKLMHRYIVLLIAEVVSILLKCYQSLSVTMVKLFLNFRQL